MLLFVLIGQSLRHGQQQRLEWTQQAPLAPAFLLPPVISLKNYEVKMCKSTETDMFIHISLLIVNFWVQFITRQRFTSIDR